MKKIQPKVSIKRGTTIFNIIIKNIDYVFTELKINTKGKNRGNGRNDGILSHAKSHNDKKKWELFISDDIKDLYRFQEEERRNLIIQSQNNFTITNDEPKINDDTIL